MITIYHASDLHVRTSILGYINNRRVQSLLKKISQYHNAHCASDTAAAILTGDLTDEGKAGEYRKLQNFLAAIDPRITVRVVPGNHDNGSGIGFSRQSAVSFDQLAVNLGFDPQFINKYNKEYPGYEPYSEKFTDSTGTTSVLVVYLNSCCEDGKEDFATGNIGMYQLNCLEKLLAERGNIPCILCLHHKPVDRAIPQFIMDLAAEDRKALLYLVKKYNVGAILSGHQSPLNCDRSVITTDNGRQCILRNANGSVKHGFFYKLTVSETGVISAVKID